jgi:hypothetical protein
MRFNRSPNSVGVEVGVDSMQHVDRLRWIDCRNEERNVDVDRAARFGPIGQRDGSAEGILAVGEIKPFGEFGGDRRDRRQVSGRLGHVAFAPPGISRSNLARAPTAVRSGRRLVDLIPRLPRRDTPMRIVRPAPAWRVGRFRANCDQRPALRWKLRLDDR